MASVNEWISAKEQQPDRKGVYLVHLSDGRMKIMGYSENLMKLEPRNFCEAAPGWYMQDAGFGVFTVTNVTHWRSLPEPPGAKKSGARLMSREDMKKLKGYTPVWEETFNQDYGTELLPAIVGHGEVVTVEGTFDLDKPWIFETEYTKIRYWDKKPTEEERKAEPWPEEETGDA